MSKSTGITCAAIIIVSAMIVATVGCVVVHDDSSNPNGIIGTYYLVSYTQGGMESDGNWHWYVTGDTTYDGEVVSVYSYKDNFVRGACHLKGETYDFSGYYDPESCTFGYCSYYNYSPGSTSDVVDLLYGSIDDGVMILTGYTASAKTAASAYAFNFVFAKKGVHYEGTPYVPLTGGASSTKVVNAYIQNDVLKDQLLGNVYTYTFEDCVNGVYRIKITDTGAVDPIYASAVSVYKNADSEILKCLYKDGGAIQYEWIHVTNSSIDYVIRGSSDGELDSTTIFFKNHTDPTSTTFTGAADAATFSGTKNEISNYKWNTTYTASQHTAGSFSFSWLAESSWNYKFLLTTWAGTDLYSYNVKTTIGGVSYFGEVLGHKCGDGHLHSFGFLYSVNGDVLVVKKTVTL